MRSWVVVLLLLTGCAGKRIAGEAKAPEYYSVPTHSKHTGWGHACPFSPQKAWTAEHVSSVPLPNEFGSRPVYVMAGFGKENRTLMEISADARRDLSIVEIVDGPVWGYRKLSAEAPEIGEELEIQPLDLDGGTFAPKPKTVTLRYIVVDALIYSEGGASASGSCVIRKKTGEVVAIHTNGREEFVFGSKTIKAVGFGLSVWGEWGVIPPMFDPYAKKDE